MRKESESNPYRQIFEIGQEGIWTFDTENRVSLANRRICEMLGYSVDEMVGLDIFEFIDESDRETVRNALARRRGGLTEHYDLRLRRKDGDLIWTTVSACPILEDDRYAGALCMTADITARKKAEEELQRSEQRFALVAKALNEVVYEMDMATGRVTFSEGMRDVYGHDTTNTAQWWIDNIHSGDRDR